MSNNLSTLLRALTDKDGQARKRARDELIELGTAATPGLGELLKDKRTHVRWEAAKALSEIGDPRSAPALVTALEDNDPGIRWMGAEGLIKLETAALPTLFAALVDNGGSIRLREGADHVLKVLAKNEKLPASAEPVLQALHGPASPSETSRAAKHALETL